VPEDDRHRHVEERCAHAQVRVADARGVDLHDHLVEPRLVEPQLLEVEGGILRLGDGGGDCHRVLRAISRALSTGGGELMAGPDISQRFR
jgi:hypothetical protein